MSCGILNLPNHGIYGRRHFNFKTNLKQSKFSVVLTLKKGKVLEAWNSEIFKDKNWRWFCAGSLVSCGKHIWQEQSFKIPLECRWRLHKEPTSHRYQHYASKHVKRYRTVTWKHFYCVTSVYIMADTVVWLSSGKRDRRVWKSECLGSASGARLSKAERHSNWD